MAKPRTLFVTGNKKLDRVLSELPFRIQGRILRGALKECMEPVLEEVKRVFPRDTGRTARLMRIKVGKPRRDGSRSVKLGVFRGTKGAKRHNFATARAIEFGTVDLPAQFPLRKSLSAKQAAALGVLETILAREIPKQAAEFHRTGN